MSAHPSKPQASAHPSKPQASAHPSKPQASARWTLAAITLAALLLLGAATVQASQRRELRLPLDDRKTAEALTAGFHDRERDARGAYRWTAGAAQALVALPGAGRAASVSMWLGPAVPGHPPPELTVRLSGAPPVRLAVREEPRRYTLLAPPWAGAAGQVELRLASPTFSLPPDPRNLGVRVEGLGARSLGGAVIWPAPLPALLQLLVIAMVALAAARSGASGLGLVAVTVGAAAMLALGLWLAPAVAPPYLARLAVAAALLYGLTLLALPWLERIVLPGGRRSPIYDHRAQTRGDRAEAPRRGPWSVVRGLMPVIDLDRGEARAVWGVTLLACGLRLAGALFPPFSAYDLGLNLGRLFATVGGNLVATNEAFEFGGGVTVYPSGPYLALMPGMLAGLTPKLAVQGGIALIDGMGTLAVAALGRALGLGRRAVLFGALAYAAVPIGLTTLWYGHTAQAFGQALMVPLAVALLMGMRGAGGPWPWLVAGALLAMALLSHIGVSILALAWLGLLWLAVTLQAARGAQGGAGGAEREAQEDRSADLSWAVWRPLTATLLAGGLAGLLFVYGPALLGHLDTLGSLGSGGDGVAPRPSYNLIAKAFWIAYTPLGLLLAVAGTLLVRPRALPKGAAELLGAWTGAVALFWAVEMATGLQVRYLVFLTPLACLAAGLALAWLAGRGRWGLWLAWALAAAIVAQGAALWLGGIFGPTAPSMVPLLR